MQKTISTLVGMLAAVGAFHAHAAGLQVNPTSLSLPAKQRAGIFTLGNTGSEFLFAPVFDDATQLILAVLIDNDAGS